MSKDLASYLSILVSLKLIRKEYPITDSIRKRKSQYFIENNFFKFWFRFCRPNLSSLEMGNTDPIMNQIRENYDFYISKEIFERICAQFIWILNQQEELPFQIQTLGRWWEKENEIEFSCDNPKWIARRCKKGCASGDMH